jgi:uncharacterized protein (DUF1684 family)
MSASATTAWLTILVVDDYEGGRTVFRHLTEAQGYAVAEAADDEAAVEAQNAPLPERQLFQGLRRFPPSSERTDAAPGISNRRRKRIGGSLLRPLLTRC